MPKTSKSNNKEVKELPADKAVFVNDERPYMMYVGARTATKAGWTKTTDVPKGRKLMLTETGMYVLAKAD